MTPTQLRGVGLAVSAIACLLAATLAWAAQRRIAGDSDPLVWGPEEFVLSATGALATVLLASVLAVVQLRHSVPGVSRAVEVASGLAVSGAAAFAVSCAVAAERQNYWDAIHFAALVWVGILAALSSVVVSVIGSRRGDAGVQRLGWVPGFVLAAWLFLWSVTWFGPLGDFIAWVASSWYLATHG